MYLLCMSTQLCASIQCNIIYISDCLIGSGSLLKSHWVLALQLIVDLTLRAMLASGSSGSNAYVPGTGHHRVDVHRVKEFPS